MRRRFSLLGVLGLLTMALVAPPVASAANYTYVVVDEWCNGDKPNITIRMKKPAGAYPDKFQIVAQGQHRNIGSSSWRNEGGSTIFTKDVPQQNAKWSWTKSIVWNPPDSNWHRIKLRLKVIDNGSVIATANVNSLAC